MPPAAGPADGPLPRLVPGPALWVAYEDLGAAGRRWATAEEEAAGVVRDLGAASSSGLPPSVRAAADAFLTAWLGYAARSRALAAGLERALGLAAADLLGADGGAAAVLGSLGGPALPASAGAAP